MTTVLPYTPGYRVDNRYRLVDRMAAGHAGEVWQAVDEVLDRVVAVKLLRPAYAGEDGFVQRFRVEARLAGRLAHPGVVSVFDFGEDNGPLGSPWLVMELVIGESLATIIAREGALDPDRALDLVAQAAEAVEAAHADGVIHRDIKPANLLVTEDGRVKVTDFGIARSVGGVSLTATGEVLGTAHYLSPEQAQGQPASVASDVYALGVVLYECLSGHRPFSGSNAIAVARAQISEPPAPLPEFVPTPLRDLLDRALAKDPAQRPSGAGEFAAQMRRIREHLPRSQAGGYLDLPDVDPPTNTISISSVAAEPLVGLDGPRRARHGHRRAEHLPRPVRHPAKLTIAGLALLAGLIIVGVVAALGGPDNAAVLTPEVDRTQTTSPPASPGGSEVVAIDPAQFVGRPFDEVASTLRSLGFAVRRVDAAGDGEPGTVSGLAPAGSVAYGSTITVEVVEAPAAPADEPGDAAPQEKDKPGQDKGKGKGKGRG